MADPHTWCLDLVPVVHPCSSVEDPLLPKPGGEHVLAEDLTPHVAVIPGIIVN